MKRARAPLASAMILALSALVSTHALADESQQIWSARPGNPRIGSDFGATSPLILPSAGFGESDNAASVIIDRNGRISLNAGIGTDGTRGDALATLPWCAEASGLLRIGALGRDCLMQGTVQLELPGRVATAATGAQWRGERIDLSLAYGFSWWTPNPSEHQGAPYVTSQDLSLASGLGAQPLLPGMSGEAQGVGVNSQWRLTAESAVQLNAALNQLRLRNGGTAPALDLQQATLGVGMNYGPFSGKVTGRVNRLSEQPGYPNSYWSGIDIGVSWRTPWRGELTVGARNLVSKSEANEPTPAARNLSETSARTPYVRYKQDL
ncbi:MAG TPA: hypothetical protein VN581_10155 [Patescibacteria group bacterium]|nr:hypothetical protein [Patescibacteria group bacterium]